MFEFWVQYIDKIQATLTSVGLLVGSAWAIWLFLQQRHRQFRANVEHRIVHWLVDRETHVVRATVRFTNVGTSMIRLTGIRMWAQQVAPPPHDFLISIRAGRDVIQQGESEYPWPLLGDERNIDLSERPLEVEPGETEEHSCEFIVPAEALTYSHIPNVRKNGKVGWNTTTIHHLEGSEMSKTSPVIHHGGQGPAKAPPPKKG